MLRYMQPLWVDCTIRVHPSHSMLTCHMGWGLGLGFRDPCTAIVRLASWWKVNKQQTKKKPNWIYTCLVFIAKPFCIKFSLQSFIALLTFSFPLQHSISRCIVGVVSSSLRSLTCCCSKRPSRLLSSSSLLLGTTMSLASSADSTAELCICCRHERISGRQASLFNTVSLSITSCINVCKLSSCCTFKVRFFGLDTCCGPTFFFNLRKFLLYLGVLPSQHLLHLLKGATGNFPGSGYVVVEIFQCFLDSIVLFIDCWGQRHHSLQ